MGTLMRKIDWWWLAGFCLAALLLAFAMSGCTTTRGGQFCQVAKTPIRPTQADTAVISDQLVAQIVTLNETGQKLCGWKP